MGNSLLESALAYARSGWHVFPVEPPRLGDDRSGKRPAGHLVPRGKDDATTDEAQIRAWWVALPDASIGVACEPSGLVVLDVDVAHGKLGRESLAEFDDSLPDTLTARTGSGGLHAVYLRPPGDEPRQTIGFRPGLDLIGRGYFVAAPSPHYSGGRYEWTRRVPPAELPACLRDVRRVAPAPIGADAPAVEIVEGGRNNAMFRLGAALRATGIDADALRASLYFENRRRCVPPLDDAEVAAIADSVMDRVVPARDVAVGAVAADDVRAMFADEQPEPAAMWARDVASRPAPPTRWIGTGSRQLDALLGGGIATRQVCGVVGPPSVGKSAFATALGLAAAARVPVLHVSTELPRRELMVRYAAAIRGFPWREAMRGDHGPELSEACAALRVKLIGVDTLDRDDPVAQIAREAIAMRDDPENAAHEPPVIVIDYVQLLARGADDGMRARVGELSRRIRELAQVLDCAVVAVFSTGRGFYGGGRLEQLRGMDDPTVYLSAAKESGDVEFDCATILFLDVDQLVEGATKPARVVVARCRMGDIGAAGYRARLDVGLWAPDPLAPAEMGRKSERDAAGRDESTEAAVLDVVARYADKPWTELRRQCGVSVGVADRVKDRLVLDGRLREERRDYFDAWARPRSRVVLVRNETPAPVVAPTEVRP